MDKKISIIMPAFRLRQHINFFRQAIEGILNQTYSNWELIIICDGGYKSDIETVKSELAEHKNLDIRLFATTEQVGPGVARNIASQYATGDYITFHDSDDYSLPHRFETLMSKMDGYGVVGSNVIVKYLYDGGAKRAVKKGYSGFSLHRLLESKKARVPCHFPATILSKDLFVEMGGFEEYKYSSDSIFIIKLGYYRELSGIEKMPVVDEPLFVWNRHSHSVTTLFQNAYTLKKCQKAQRKPLIRNLRPKLLNKNFPSKKKEIFKDIGIINNLKNLPAAIELSL